MPSGIISANSCRTTSLGRPLGCSKHSNFPQGRVTYELRALGTHTKSSVSCSSGSKSSILFSTGISEILGVHIEPFLSHGGCLPWRNMMEDHSMSGTAFPNMWTPEICQKARQELLSSIWLVQSPAIWAKKPSVPFGFGSFADLNTVKKSLK